LVPLLNKRNCLDFNVDFRSVSIWVVTQINSKRSKTLILCCDLFTDKPSPVCDEAWERHGEKCYYFSTFKSSWDIGRRFCKEFGADLVKIDMKDIMTEEEDKFWIGLTDSKTEGKWVWVDNSSLDDKLQFWWNDSKPIEPDNWPGEDPDGEDCVRMGELGPVTKLNRWLDKSCKVAQRSICEKPAKRRQ
uniref:Hepatic lectin-like n=1 Tax=Sphaeramia orbicularis TaxID=375764 RepID=A0A672Z9N9_9TELE